MGRVGRIGFGAGRRRHCVPADRGGAPGDSAPRPYSPECDLSQPRPDRIEQDVSDRRATIQDP